MPGSDQDLTKPDSPGDEPVLSLKEPDAPLTLDVIKAQLAERHQLANSTLINLRAERDKLARKIRAAVAEEAEADRPVRGHVLEYGGGTETIGVDRDTPNYIDGDVVIVPAELWDRMIQPPEPLDFVVTTERPDFRPALVVRCPADKMGLVGNHLNGVMQYLCDVGGVLIIPDELTEQ